MNAVAFSNDSSAVYASGVQTLVKVDAADQPVTWQGYPTHIQDVERLPDSDELLLLTPTFDRRARTGGLVITDADGLVQSHVEFPDMSPSTVRVRPATP